MRNYDVVVIGGSAAGISAVITARRHYPDKSIMLIRKESNVLVPCGIPYIFGTTGLVINTSKYTKSLDDIGWEILFNTDLKDRVSSSDGMDSFMMILD